METTLPLEDDFDFEDDVEDFDDTLDYSHKNLNDIDFNELLTTIKSPNRVINFELNSNKLLVVPNEIEKFQSLITLELSNNQLVQLPHEIGSLKNLKNLHLKNNALSDLSFPKEMLQLKQLELINLIGNRFKQFPHQLFHMINLKEIYLSSNQITMLSDQFQNFTKVEVLYLGANRIGNIPDSIGCMCSLIVLNLCDNRLRTLPRSISRLTQLKSLSLHNNQFCALPPDIIRLDLQELSLRNNPLVVRFVRDLTYDVPSLKELAARTIKLHKINYDDKSIPKVLVDYLNSAKSCLNPKCKGVYFESCHKSVKFVDFCGKFYLPLLQFLCSPACTSTSTCQMATTHSDDMNSKFRKVLLG
ncbi:unnamed protein product [Rotaria magnacalcarata]|uniref:Leucine-rich repeat-containing protein 58 n=2 Tax=Rotaria magnacalcarata TaxID=392030 RepID=A0A815SUT4_9BILA|nr:unnamed protein product [Rotaria magnacalcarata]CAF1622333.1 unnamed protein product [Rotaria magnacalcarata]CAF2112565.1 unnamed protein product [Rotaria magnacalcarata]CAF4058305.1 unnamed protein product [Rotaria magnacalcarata]